VAVQDRLRDRRPADLVPRPDGKQYVAVLSGVGGWAGAVVAGNLDTRDTTAATGFANVVSDLKSRTALGGALYVFALP
jgi:alcohol dehydrogenase (cytochrome c)